MKDITSTKIIIKSYTYISFKISVQFAEYNINLKDNFYNVGKLVKFKKKFDLFDYLKLFEYNPARLCWLSSIENIS